MTLVELYAKRIRAGKLSLENVPECWKAEVESELEKLKSENTL